MKLAANLSLLFTEFPFLARFEQAALAGFKGVEVQFPYAFSAGAIAEQLQHHELEMVLINLPAGNWEAGDRGIACQTNRQNEFREGVELALEYAALLGCPRLNCLSGVSTDDNATGALDVFRENLEYACKALKSKNKTLLFEAINTYDIPGFLVHNLDLAQSLLQDVAADNLAFQFDAYHMQRMGEDLTDGLQRLEHHIGHIQIADTPGRHEPGTGTLDFHQFFQALNTLPYSDWVSLEYLPLAGTHEGLSWLKNYPLTLSRT